MGREKATITLDRDKVRKASALIGAPSMSEVVDIALDRLIATERLRRDLAAYAREPLSADEIALAGLPLRLDLADEDTDYGVLYDREA
jgi:hypothetical protein